jgi:hypothetical protein
LKTEAACRLDICSIEENLFQKIFAKRIEYINPYSGFDANASVNDIQRNKIAVSLLQNSLFIGEDYRSHGRF